MLVDEYNRQAQDGQRQRCKQGFWNAAWSSGTFGGEGSRFISTYPQRSGY